LKGASVLQMIQQTLHQSQVPNNYKYIKKNFSL